MSSRDGYSWTQAQGLKAGVPCIGAIQPPTTVNPTTPQTFDVIVVGAGHCGLTAARDASLSGLEVLLLEGRDRIGGRSWSSNIGGYPFEMGGTWVHWGQPNVWREIMRYQMQDELEVSYDFAKGINKFILTNAEGSQKLTHDKEDAIMESGLCKLVNVDVADRIAEIKDSLTWNERIGFEASVLLCSGGTLETASFFEFLHRWALSEYSYECIRYLVKYKFRGDGCGHWPCHQCIKVHAEVRNPELRQTVLGLKNVKGTHALVWTYSIGAAESFLPEHREFFSERLKAPYEYTRFGGIPAALEALKTVWAEQAVRRWTDVVVSDAPILVM
ncbi:hypothetical protein QQZ08_005403 [Neonectria magnoliae]|uniref:Amine oxidase domain-containing protein n=1 Tax=Neonectria magnoliae TaxID=2732573 RepID=A0ABR1I5G7_9HYPO